MSWAWITEDGITVDLFDFPDLRDQYQLPLEPPPGVATVKVFEPYLPSLPDRARERDRPSNGPERPFVDPINPQLLFEGATETAHRLLADLYETAPPPPRQQYLFDKPVRGEWTAVDLFGPTGKQFFLGVLAQPADQSELDLVAARPSEQSADTESDHRLQAALVDRLLVVVAEGSAPPSWIRLRRTLE